MGAIQTGPITHTAGISRMALRFQLIALGMSSVAVLFGLFCMYGATSASPCGDDPGPMLSVMMAWLIDAPIGLGALAVGMFIQRGFPLLRRICLAIALLTLAMPVVTSMLFDRHHC